MWGIMVREFRLVVNTPINVGLSIITPLLYGFLFATSLAGSVDTVAVGGTVAKYLTFVAPGIGGLGLLIYANMCGTSVWQERISGMLREIASCPISAAEYVAGKTIANSGMSMIQGMLVMLVFTMLLDKRVTLLQILLGLLVMLGGGIALVSLYCTLWTLMPSTQAGSLAANILTMVMLFTAPVFYSVDSMPPVLRSISGLNPLTHIVLVLRAVLLGQTLRSVYLVGVVMASALLMAVNTIVLGRSMSAL